MARQPNILLITADQMRWDCMGCVGNEHIQTPNLDALASRGVLFKNGFTPNPICVPARATIMTGNYPHVCTGSRDNGGRIREGQPLLTEVLKGAGYRTYALGKLHFVPYSPPGEPRLVHGFEHVDLTESGRMIARFDPEGKLSGLEDYFDYLKDAGWAGYTRAHGVGNNDVRPCPSPLPEELYVDHWIADCTVRQLERHAKEFTDRPFFMWMSSPKPHSPYDPPRPYDALYDPRALPAPFAAAEGLAQGLEGRSPALEGTRVTHALDSLSPQAWQVIRSYYYGCITFLDAQIGRVTKKLEAMGLLEDTLVLFTADHGDLLGDFGTAFKANHMNGSVRVPFIVAGPGVRAGAVSEALVGLQDVLPTFASAAAGADHGQSVLKQPVHGIDLTSHLADTALPVRDLYYSQTGEPPRQSVMVTDGSWKYIYSQPNGLEELYDQVTDRREEHNVAGDPGQSERLEDMRKRLRGEAEELGDTRILGRDGFVRSDLDREKIRARPVSGMGWRWY